MKLKKFLTYEEELALAEKMFAGDDGADDARWQLVLRYEPYITKTAIGALKSRGLSLKLVDELKNHLMLTAHKEALGFKPEKGRFSTYLRLHLLTASTEFCAESKYQTKLSSIQFRQLVKVNKAVSTLRHEGKEINIKAVAGMTDLPLPRVKSILKKQYGVVVSSLNRPVRQEDHGGELEFIDLMVDENTPDGEEALMVKRDREREIELLREALTILKDREKKIILMRYSPGREQLTTLEEISQVHGISRERVRQIIVRATEKMRKHIKNKGGV